MEKIIPVQTTISQVKNFRKRVKLELVNKIVLVFLYIFT